MPEAQIQASQLSSLLYPLDEVYEDLRMPLPLVSLIDGHEMPEPYRSLLVHDTDMTSTLEAAYRQRIHLHVIKYRVRDNVLMRHVVLVLEDDHTAVELGAIKIYLQRLPEQVRALILEANIPLGTILREMNVVHESHPAAYFRIMADSLMAKELFVKGRALLYGRRNVITGAAGETLAEVVEILPEATGLPGSEDGRG